MPMANLVSVRSTSAAFVPRYTFPVIQSETSRVRDQHEVPQDLFAEDLLEYREDPDLVLECLESEDYEPVPSERSSARWKYSLLALTDRATSFFERIETRGAVVKIPAQLRLARWLSEAFEAEPFEDGMDHPAEEIIGNAIHSGSDSRVFDWISEICLDAERPAFAASILRCLGRIVYPGQRSWRTELVRKALTMDNIQIRDAAIQATENWGGNEIRNVLRTHHERSPWLRNYLQSVIDDLED